MNTSRRSRGTPTGIAVLLVLAIAAGVAVAAEPAGKATQIEAPPPEPGADGWYDASPLDGSFRVRIPVPFQAFSEQGKSESGAVTHTIGVRAKASAAFGGVTNYFASCIDQEGDARNPTDRLRAVVDRWDERGMMRYQRPIEADAVPGFEFEIVDDVKVIRGRIYAPKTGTCTVLISWRPFAPPSDADIGKYLDSFHFNER